MTNDNFITILLIIIVNCKYFILSNDKTRLCNKNTQSGCYVSNLTTKFLIN